MLSLQPGIILLKKYKIVSEIARGGMAVVYRARHVHYDEEMALKILKEADEHAFVAEARVLRRLNHPHIVRVEDADFLEDGRPFLAMEFIDGEDLAARLLRTGPMRLEEALRIAAEACSGLAAAHDAGMIHRDINPKNLLIARGEDSAETVKLIDFGIAKVRKEAGIGFTGVQQGTTGFFLGTPRYASPEQALLSPLDGRTDIYSMGLVLHEMLTGRPPPSSHSDEATLQNRQQWSPVPPHHIRPDVPLPVSSIVMRALQHDRAARYQTAYEMQNACESVRAVLIGEETRRTRLEAPPAMASKVEGKAPPGWDYTRPSVAEPSAGTAGQARVPVAGSTRSRAALALALVVTALVAWRIVTDRGRTNDHTTRVENGKTPVPRGEDPKVGGQAFHGRGKTGTDVDAGAESAKEGVREALAVWASTMLSNDLAGQVDCYAPTVAPFFQRPSVTLQEVAADKERMMKTYPLIKKYAISNISFEHTDANRVVVSFDKSWEAHGSRIFAGSERQSLELRPFAGRWRIIAERELQIYWVRTK